MTFSLVIKKFFKDRYGIPVRVRSTGTKHPYFQAWIPCVPTPPGDHSLRYVHAFPPELGNRCMRIIYGGHAGLEAQDWGGNVGAHGISMLEPQWRELLADVAVPATV